MGSFFQCDCCVACKPETARHFVTPEDSPVDSIGQEPTRSRYRRTADPISGDPLLRRRAGSPTAAAPAEISQPESRLQAPSSSGFGRRFGKAWPRTADSGGIPRNRRPAGVWRFLCYSLIAPCNQSILMWTRIALLIVVACSHGRQSRPPAAQPQRAASRAAAAVPLPVPPPDYTIGPDDKLSIVFWKDTEITSEVVVRPDGRISLPLLNDVQAAGLTPDQLRERLLVAAVAVHRRSGRDGRGQGNQQPARLHHGQRREARVVPAQQARRRCCS